ncbi:hypothetical protein [Amycolatopsis orientalis]|uniref:hypothetical protein n=1 Tax=Amycolatopsis orientalis TaxID=31958 RepID=UPI0003FA60D7|nr:hypothetical protein [Amycolatopsis orientalis]
MTAVRESVRRLRPGVRTTPTAEGLLFRGPLGTFTARGGPDLPVLWQRISPVLAGGLSADAVESACSTGKAGRIVRGLLDSLDEHGMLLTSPAGWAEHAIPSPTPGFAAWLEQMTVDPAEAWNRCVTSRFTVSGTGPVAETAASALALSGIPAHRRAGQDPRLVLVRADGFQAFAGADRRLGFAGQAETDDGGAIADRLGLGTSAPESAVAELAGSLVVQRLLRQVADPAGTRPRVLVVRPDPLRATAHPWPVGIATSPTDLATATTALDALCDPELGSLAAPEFTTLRQVPLGMAVADGIPAWGTTVDAARLAAGLAAAGRRLDPDGTRGTAVGGDELHAAGIVWRRAILGRTTPLDGDEYRPDPDTAAARWLSTVTVRFGLDARCRVARPADGVFVAVVTDAAGVRSRAVEGTAADAAAHAWLGAAGAEQARRSGLTPPPEPFLSCGATLPVAGPRPELWSPPRDHEPEFQRCLRRALPDVRPPRPSGGAAAPGLAAALRATGFVALDPGSTP